MINNNNNNPDGIFVLNGQIFSVNDLINIMRRHGISIRLTRDGLSIDGEQISSVSNLDGNKCPLAGNCEKRVALVEFLKLQKSQPMNQERVYDKPTNYDSPSVSSRDNFDYQEDFRDNYQDLRRDSPRDEQSRDFIKPNNHDLFEGNVSNSRGLFDEPPQEEVRGLFDEPDFKDESNEDYFENSFFNRNEYSERELSREDQFESKGYRPEPREMNQHFCKRCGFDIDLSWNSCPKCGQRIISQNPQKTDSDYLF
ncbi:MAG TPA: hypothetical protein VMZ29_06280 [Candidatus Bathyarchaeia archaeon]|nr:hypothetical protein [Candidatus Bathyarchaeia archaeon]